MYKIIEFNNNKFITIPHLNDLGLKNCITTSSLNMRLDKNSFPIGSIDDYIQVFKFLNIKSHNLFSNIQNHTDNITIINDLNMGDNHILGRRFKNNDGLITNLKDITLASFSADCTPIILFDKKNKIQANIHSGWKGTLQMIGPKALLIMINSFNSSIDDIIVVLGPSISQDDFEVKKDVYSQFQNNFFNITEYSYKLDEKYHINLDRLNIDNFLSLGILEKNIININMSTFSNDLFHSYRRDKENYKLMGTFTNIYK